MPAKSSPGSKENLFSGQLPVIQTRSWQISKQGLLRRTREGNSVALIHAGISPDYNHLFCLYSARMMVKNSVKGDGSGGDCGLGTNTEN